MRLPALHAALLQEIQGPTYWPLLLELTSHHLVFATHDDWKTVADVVADPLTTDDAIDAVLHPLLVAYAISAAVTPAPATATQWATILTACCFRWLVATAVSRARWDQDPDEVWQETQVCFLALCRRLCIQGRTHRLRAKIRGDLRHTLTERFQPRWRAAARERAGDPAAMVPEAAAGTAPPSHEDVDADERLEHAIATLRRQHRAGRITATDVLILVGTHLYGRSLAAQAGILGMTPNAVGRRRLRAHTALRNLTRGWE